MVLPIETMIGQKREFVFKRYGQRQMLNIPVAMEQLISNGCLSRIIDHVVELIPMNR